MQHTYLQATEIINYQHPKVQECAKDLTQGLSDPFEITQRCFEWVRDTIKHSVDFQMNPITCTASEVLKAGTGFCYAKSHLLAALLRANSIPTGLCYQRLSINEDGAPFCLHGLNAAHLPDIGWYRIDPRGNKSGINAQFNPPQEQLAFPLEWQGEADLPEIWAEPLPVVVESLRTHETYDALLADLPDIPLISTPDRPTNPL